MSSRLELSTVNLVYSLLISCLWRSLAPSKWPIPRRGPDRELSVGLGRAMRCAWIGYQRRLGMAMAVAGLSRASVSTVERCGRAPIPRDRRSRISGGKSACPPRCEEGRQPSARSGLRVSRRFADEWTKNSRSSHCLGTRDSRCSTAHGPNYRASTAANRANRSPPSTSCSTYPIEEKSSARGHTSAAD